MAERCGRVALHAHYEAKQKRILDRAEATRRQRLGFGAADRGGKASRAAASAAAEAEAAAAAAEAAAAAAAEKEVEVARRRRGEEARELQRRLLGEEARQRLAERGRCEAPRGRASRRRVGGPDPPSYPSPRPSLTPSSRTPRPGPRRHPPSYPLP